MDIQTRKIRFVQEFLKLQSEQTISHLEKALQKETKSPDREAFQPMSMVELNKRIDQSMEDSKNGRLIEAGKLKAKMKKWG